MQRINLSYFYFLGVALGELKGMALTAPTDEDYLLLRSVWSLQAFLRDTVEMSFPISRGEADRLRQTLEEHRKVTPEYPPWIRLKREVETFESVFQREAVRASVFSVQTKGIYDTEKLIEAPESRFSERIRNALPAQTLYDLQQAGKCLAYNVHTAAAFHTLRATEVLMIHYYIALTGKAWPFNQRDWGIYIRELKNERADTRITERLDEIRKFVRNPILHPEVNVDADQALPLFELTGGVIVLIVEELLRLTPNVTAVSTS